MFYGKLMNIGNNCVYNTNRISGLGNTSNADLSTNLILKCQSCRRSLVMIVNRIAPRFVSCGIPSLVVLRSDNGLPILTVCFLFDKKSAIQLEIAG